MKKSILVGTAALLISITSFAGSNLSEREYRDTVKINYTLPAHPDGVMMTEGTMKLVKDEVVTAMVVDITMLNGTIVSVDGTIVTKDKTQTMMKEGQHMDMNGVITEMKVKDK